MLGDWARIVRAMLAEARHDLAGASKTEQEAILDDAFRASGHRPTAAEWDAEARRGLPAYQGGHGKPS